MIGQANIYASEQGIAGKTFMDLGKRHICEELHKMSSSSTFVSSS
jgi:hypothetical protein